ncbi:DUF998 domain-containing protein [Microbacterium sp. C5A9]|uniref:DUF998 domain-containing protein n=1 Tax=Microbacterium sp. C5A9 TaxID=2736663 RepID=UPI001F51C7D1|nr:DUF998 domain-containing protein [Microbacterium sp. C5A9]MCI1019111.1 DUF998 domain-containing protein [Microbacterium sp. C5A9]
MPFTETPPRSFPSASVVARAAAALIGSVLVGVALALIWLARLSTDRVLYVSGLGADGEPTAGAFEIALVLLALGGFCVAAAARGLRATAPVLRAWTPALSIVIASALFLLASQVPCTAGCPLPVGDTFSWQDLVHTTAAVLAFALAAVAMLQTSFVDGRRVLRTLSLGAGISTAVVAAAGGLLSLLRFRTDVGSILELVATTIGMGWLMILGFAISHASALDAAQEQHGVVRKERGADRIRSARHPLVFAR